LMVKRNMCSTWMTLSGSEAPSLEAYTPRDAIYTSEAPALHDEQN